MLFSIESLVNKKTLQDKKEKEKEGSRGRPAKLSEGELSKGVTQTCQAAVLQNSTYDTDAEPWTARLHAIAA